MPSRARSCPLDSGCVTAAPCIVDLQVRGLRVGEELLEHLRSLSAFTDFRIDHHVPDIEGADSEKPRRKYIRDGVDSVEGSIGDLPHVDGMGGAIGRVCRLVLEIEKQKFLAKFGVRHAHAAWHEWIVGNDAASPHLMELGVGHGEQRAELIRRKSKNAK